MNGNVKEWKQKIGIAMAAVMLASVFVFVAIVPAASAAAVQTAGDGNAEGGELNETAFWAFVLGFRYHCADSGSFSNYYKYIPLSQHKRVEENGDGNISGKTFSYKEKLYQKK